MSKLNSEFNYRYQVLGETPWHKIHYLKDFLAGRKRTAVEETIFYMELEAKQMELAFLMKENAAQHIIHRLKADIFRQECSIPEVRKNFQDNRDEVEILERLLAELYELVEPTRIPGYSDEQMFEVNAANEFTLVVAKEIQAEIIATGHPSPAKLHNAMSNPYTLAALQKIGLIPDNVKMLGCSIDPLKIEVF